MWIYNYLFYKSFVAAKKSKNFEDIPVLGGLMFLVLCIEFNFFTVLGFLEGLGVNTFDEYILKYKWFFAFGLLGLLLFYYSYKSRYKKIIKYYDDRKDKMIQIPAFIVIIIYYLGSFGLLLLAGLYKNRDWIFANM